MSALGQKQTLTRLVHMSASPPIADIESQSRNVRFVPKADIMQCSNSRSIGASTDEFLPEGSAGCKAQARSHHIPPLARYVLPRPSTSAPEQAVQFARVIADRLHIIGGDLQQPASALAMATQLP